MKLGFSPVISKPVQAKTAVKFGNSTDECGKYIQSWMDDIKAGKVSVNSRQGYDVTVTRNNKQYVVSDIGAPQMGTAPDYWSVTSTDGTESLYYSGPGCFGQPSVRFNFPGTRGYAEYKGWNDPNVELMNQLSTQFEQLFKKP